MHSWKNRKRLIASAAIGTLAGLILIAVQARRFVHNRQSRTVIRTMTTYTKISSTTTTTYTDRDVTAGQVLHYYVTASNAEGESPSTNVLTVTIPSTPGEHSTTITWSASAVDSAHRAATRYNIYRGREVQVPQTDLSQSSPSGEFRFAAKAKLRDFVRRVRRIILSKMNS